MQYPKKLFCILMYFILAVSQIASGNEKILNGHDAYVLLDNLLDLTDSPKDIDQHLAQYKEWERIYAKLIKNKMMSKKEIKIILFMIFIATEKNIIHSQEEMAEEIMPLFTKQSSAILGILKELPFLIPSTCGALNNHFVLYSNKEEKQQFVKKYENIIVQSLGKEGTANCLIKLKNN